LRTATTMGAQCSSLQSHHDAERQPNEVIEVSDLPLTAWAFESEAPQDTNPLQLTPPRSPTPRALSPDANDRPDAERRVINSLSSIRMAMFQLTPRDPAEIVAERSCLSSGSAPLSVLSGRRGNVTFESQSTVFIEGSGSAGGGSVLREGITDASVSQSLQIAESVRKRNSRREANRNK